MSLNNSEIAEKLYQYADLLEASGSNPYRVRAYRRAAKSILHLSEDLNTLISNKVDITSIPAIGKGIAFTINTILTTNHLPNLKNNLQIKKVNELIEVTGLGKKRIKILNQEFNIYTKKDLYKAIQAKKLKNISWLTPAFSARILKELHTPKKVRNFLRLYHAIPTVNLILEKLTNLAEIKQVVAAGDFRRRQEIVEQLDFVIHTTDLETVTEKVMALSEVRDVLVANKHLISVILWAGVKANMYLVAAAEFPTSLLMQTGNATHIQELSQLIKAKHFILNKSGLLKNKKRLRLNKEADIYNYLDLPFIEPELREGRGEVKAALKNSLPKLVELADIKGDLHCHTNETDGTETLETMVTAAAKKGYQYIAITDHSKHLAITNGLDEKRLLKQIEKIDKLNAKLKNILILKSIEVDILEDGSLDLSDEVLKELDLVVCSIHSKFKLPEDKQTERIIRAMDNPYFNILGHATGRLIRSRPPYPIDIQRILKAAKGNHCFIELNSQPYRLDINDIYAKMAKAMGVKLAISSDAHSIRELKFMQLGIYQGRRGWLETEDVINTRPWPALRKLLIRK